MPATLTRKKSASRAAKRLVEQFAPKVKEVEIDEPPEMAGLVVLGTCFGCGTSHPRDKRWLGHYLGEGGATHSFVPQVHLGLAQDPRDHWSVFEHYDSPAALEAAPGGAGEGLFAAMKERFLFALSTWVARKWLNLQEITDAVGDLPFLPDAAAVKAQEAGAREHRQAQEEARRQAFINFQRKKDPEWTWPTRPDGTPMSRREIGRQAIRRPLEKQIAKIVREEEAEKDERESGEHPGLGLTPIEPETSPAPAAPKKAKAKKPKSPAKVVAEHAAEEAKAALARAPVVIRPKAPLLTQVRELARQIALAANKGKHALEEGDILIWEMSEPDIESLANALVALASKADEAEGGDLAEINRIGEEVFEARKNIRLVRPAWQEGRRGDALAAIDRLINLQPPAAPTEQKKKPPAPMPSEQKFDQRYSLPASRKMATYLEALVHHIGNNAILLGSFTLSRANVVVGLTLEGWIEQRIGKPEEEQLRLALGAYGNDDLAGAAKALRELDRPGGPEGPQEPAPAPGPLSPRAAAAIARATPKPAAPAVITPTPTKGEAMKPTPIKIVAAKKTQPLTDRIKVWQGLLDEEKKAASIKTLEKRLDALDDDEQEQVEGLEDLRTAIQDYRDADQEDKENKWEDLGTALQDLSFIEPENEEPLDNAEEAEEPPSAELNAFAADLQARVAERAKRPT